MATDDDENKRTLIKIGPKWANIGYVSVTAGDAVRTTEHCKACGAVMWEFTLYIWTPDGPMPIHTATICGSDKQHPEPEDPTETEPEE